MLEQKKDLETAQGLIDVTKFEKAIEYLTEYIEEEGEISKVYNLRGYAFMQTQETENAIKDFDRALSLNGSDDLTHWYLSQIYSELGEFDKAKNHISIVQLFCKRFKFFK